MTTEDAVRAACLLEVTARKAGNVHPLASFPDCDWHAFAASADATAPVLAAAPGRRTGETILRAVEATRERVGRNTNLGIILLLAPLAAVPEEDDDLRAGTARILGGTTADDCRFVYEAIRRAAPGGLGTADREDVSSSPTVTLVEAMTFAAGRDAVARQYATGFGDVFRFSGLLTARDLPTLELEIVTTHLRMIAAGLETLIGRKCGPVIAAEAADRAAGVLEAMKEEPGRAAAALRAFDDWLRADGNRRNPGATADLTAAALFVAIRDRRVPCFDASAVSDEADRIRRSGRPLPDPRPL